MRRFTNEVKGIVSENRVKSEDVIKIKFLKLWDLSGYSERTMSKREGYVPKMSISLRLVCSI